MAKLKPDALRELKTEELEQKLAVLQEEQFRLTFRRGTEAVANPLQFWFIGRRGPVRTADFYKLLAPFVCAVGVAMVACLMLRKFTVINSPVVGFASSAIVMGAVTLLVLCVLPRGRSALLDLKMSLRLLKSVNSAPAPVQAHE